MMKTLLLSSAVLFALAIPSSASVQNTDSKAGISVKKDISDMEAKRRKPRVPGGSGCDSPRDKIEHPECAQTPPAQG